MIDIKCYCDKCHKQIPVLNYNNVKIYKKYSVGSVDITEIDKNYCYDCFQIILKYLGDEEWK